MKRIGLTLAAILLMAFPLFSQIINVPADHSTIQSAIDSASTGDTVLVAEGTYFENIGFRGKAITLASHFILDGDTSHISRTVIDGSKAPDPDKAIVVSFNSCQDTTSVLNGFTITGGKGMYSKENFSGELSRMSGGIGIINAGGKVVNNIISGNSLSDNGCSVFGGGIYVSAGPGNGTSGWNVVLKNNTIFNNHITGDTYTQGAGIYIESSGKQTIIIDQNRIYQNTVTCTGVYKANAGGIQLSVISPWYPRIIIRNNLIYQNEIHCVASHGGAIFVVFTVYNQNLDGRKSGIEIYNNLIADNYSQDKGGGIAVWDITGAIADDFSAYNDKYPNPLIYNNTITGNRAAEGAGLYNFNTHTLLFNNIFWDQSTSGEGEISLSEVNVPTNYGRFQSYFNDVRGGFPGAGNIDQDPLFDPEEYSLMEKSPCIGWGGDSVYISGKWLHAPGTDLLDINRRQASADHKIDMGALESAFEQIKRPGYDSEHIINIPDEQATIQAAIDVASERDTVLVAPWIYYENVDFKGKAITLMSYYGMDGDESHISNTVIDGGPALNSDTASVVCLVSGEDTTSILKGFTITGGTGTSTESQGFTNREGGGILMFKSGGLIEHNIITANKIEESGTDWTLGAGISASNDNTRTAIIRNNIVSGNTIDSESQSNGGGISLGGANFIVEHNQIDNNICKTTSPVSYGGGIGWWSFDSPEIMPSLRIANNDIFQNSVSSSAADINTTGGGVRLISTLNQGEIDILNNRVYDNTSDGSGAGLTLIGTTNTDMQNNLVYNNSCEQAGGGLALSGATSTVIRNNTIFDNSAKRGVKSLFLSEGSSVVLFNNILWSDRNKAKKEITSSTEDESNTLHAFHNSIRGGWDTQWNMDVEPAFAADYYLSENSLCIGRGADSVQAGGIWYPAPEWDMLGNPRKSMERIDLGAIESSFAKLDSFAIISLDTTLNTPSCEGEARISFTGGTPPFSFYLDGEPNEGNSFEYLCNGTHVLSVIDGDGEELTATIDIVTGIDKPETGDLPIKIYPNPMGDFCRIQVSGPTPLEKIELYDLSGRLVFSENKIGASSFELSKGNLANGIYILKVHADRTYERKLLIR